MTTDVNKLRDYLKRATVDLRHARQRLREAESKNREPIAIVGMSCRFPGGVRSPEDLWSLVESGGDAISGFPTDRGWDLDALFHPDPEHPGTSYTREGGFLHDAADFDADFFGIGPREALAMDPQQRLILEASWEAVERAELDPAALKGSRTGVFAGVMYHDYVSRLPVMPEGIEGYVSTGNTGSVVSGRIAYTLGLEGPAVTIDTACSSSLVALHLAVQALRQGECDLALAGGVTVMAGPTTFVEFSRQRGLAPDGRCRAFAASANGTGWSEGVGMLLVERLSDAHRLGHPVLAVVRGSAVNQDGASNGLTAPNGPSQVRVIHQALANARLAPADVDAVEAHGTGTSLGDPIEAQALLAAYGKDRDSDRPLWLGSVKSNLGHTQAAAGVAGVIKMVQALRHGVVPKTLHIDSPTPHVDWSAGAVHLATANTPWPEQDRPRRAAVSAFGVSGTNAHVVIEQHEVIEEHEPQLAAEPSSRPSDDQDRTTAGAQESGTVHTDAPSRHIVETTEGGPDQAGQQALIPWPLSGKSAAALAEQADRLRSHLAKEGAEGAASGQPRPSDIGYSLATTRTDLAHRAVLLANDRSGLAAALDALADGTAAPTGTHVVRGIADDTRQVAFVFPGQGSQWPLMALQLLDASSVFRNRIAECEQALAPHVDWSLTEVLRGAPGAPGLERVDVVQPVLFAVMVSLAEVWRSYGVRPSAVAGHSQGEIAAACVVGALSIEDAAKVVALRSRALIALAGKGGMLSVGLSLEDLTPRMEAWGERISIAAVNSPTSIVVSGDPTALTELRDALHSEDIRARMIAVDYASHSAHVEEVRERVLTALADVVPQRCDVPFYSTVTGTLLTTDELDAEYWYRSLRQTVRFDEVTRALVHDGHTALIEVSAHPVLTIGMQETLDDLNSTGVALGTLRRNEGGMDRIVQSLAEAHAQGVALDWPAVFAEAVPRRVQLPTYAFQRRRYWLDAPRTPGDAAGLGLTSLDHPLLGAVVGLADADGLLLTGRLATRTHPWLADHVVMGTVILPGAAFVELAIRAGDHLGCDLLTELTLQAPLIVPEHAGVVVQVSVGQAGGFGERSLAIHSRAEDTDPDGTWTCHATGVLMPDNPGATTATLTPDGTETDVWPPTGSTPLDLTDFYDRLAEHSFGYGSAFQGLRAAWQRGNEVFADVSLPADPDIQSDAARFGLHPALLDAALHSVGFGPIGDMGAGRIAFAWENVRLYATGATRLRVRITPAGSDAVAVVVADDMGRTVAAVDTLTFREAREEHLRAALAEQHRALYRTDWHGTPFTDAGVNTIGTCALIGVAANSPIDRVAEGLRGSGASPDVHQDLATLADSISAGALVPETVIAIAPMLDGGCARPLDNMAGNDTRTDAEVVRETTKDTLAFIQDWLGDRRFAGTRLIMLTQGAVAVPRPDGKTPDTHPEHAAIWGLIRSAQSEQPGRFVLADTDGQSASLRHLPDAIATDEPQFALRAGTMSVPRLAPVTIGAPSTSTTPGELNPHGTALITGGTGALGRLLAAHLITHHHIRNIVLTSRRGPDAEGMDQLLAELSALDDSVTVTIAACDAADRRSLAALLAALPEDRPLTAVVHAAAVVAGGLIPSLTGDDLNLVLRPKVDAALNLHELTRDMELAAFVLFSSFAGTLGGAGQGAYAAGNAFLDSLAEHRKAHGLPATSLAWGVWDARGEQTRLKTSDLNRMTRAGLVPLDASEGLRLFDTALALGDPVLAPVHLDLAALRARATSGPVPPLLRGLIRTPSRRSATTSALTGAQGALSAELAALAELPPGERTAAMVTLVRAQAAAVLGHAAPDAIDPERAFRELGFDSLAAMELRNRLGTVVGVRLPATVVFDHPTPSSLAEHLLREIPGAGPKAGTAARAAEPSHRSTDEPIAIVGMGCRFPGDVSGPEDLWHLLVTETDAITGLPTDRGWDLDALYDPDPANPGTSYVREGGFLHGAARFDPDFFGISPREALAMDPQQRQLLEVSWETFERAGIDPAQLRGSRTGVFAGTNGQDYAAGLTEQSEDALEGHLLTANSASVVSGRLSYTFGLEGPAVTVDTACSSSLVALHLAVQSLRQGECDLALAGGVTVMSTPGALIGFSRQRGLAKDARCRAFAASADGTGLSEGVGMLLVERLSDARRQGHPVLAVVRGSAVNQDGASNGLTAPNGPAQQRVIRQALANAGLGSADVDVVEAHGTGTSLGDPIEAQALLATYGQDRPADRPLLLGSLKSNIGHTQAAAGVGGVIKMVMAMRHGVVPRTLHVDEPSPHIDWSAGAVELATEPVEWAAEGRPRRAGVSSFGVSGTNAHIVIEQAPVENRTTHVDPQTDAGPVVQPWLVSAKDEKGLRAQAELLLAHVQSTPDLDLGDIALSLATTRAFFPHRAAVVGSGRDELLRGLSALTMPDREAHQDLVSGIVLPTLKTAFVFSGQGSQWWGMGRGLYELFPVFADVFDAVCVGLDGLLGCSLREVLFEGDGSGLAGTGLTQPALFVVEVALCGLLGSWGVVPGVVAGHSVGEFAAAYVAGVVSLEDACRLVVARGRLMEDLPSGGVMVAVEASEADVLPLLAGLEDRVGIAAVNSPTSIVLSGTHDAVTAVVEQLGDRRSKALTVSHAFHSPLMVPMLDAFRMVAESVTFHEPKLPIVSTVTGRLITAGEISNPNYWVQHIRQPVRYADAVQALAEQGVNVFLEVGPGGVLSGLTQTNLDQAIAIPTLRPNTAEDLSLTTALAHLHVHGTPIDWPAFYTGRGAHLVDLPTYPFQHQHYWVSPIGAREPEVGMHPSDMEFWNAVESQDLAAMAERLELQVDADTPFGTVLPALSQWRRHQRDQSTIDGWRYQVFWRALTSQESTAPSGSWLLVLPEEAEHVTATVHGISQALQGHGVDVVRLAVAVQEDRQSLAGRIRKLFDEGQAPTGVLSLLALDEEPHPDHHELPAGLALTTVLIQALGDAELAAPLWCATKGAVAIGSSETVNSARQSMIWGLGRATALEYPLRWGGLVDLPAKLDDRAAKRLLSILGTSPGGEDQFAVRASGVFVRRLRRAVVASGSAESEWQPRGTVLITGGTGALGAQVARHWARAGAEHIVLTGRRGAQAPGAVELATELDALGATVTIAACDVSNREAVADLLASLPVEHHPLTAVVHAAGVPQFGPTDSLSCADLAAVLSAKVAGAIHLDELLGDRELDAFVLFSSVAGVWGSGGQAAYSAANSFLDGLAEQRRSRGLTATAVAWGPWADAGMAGDDEAEAHLRRRGLPSMSPDLALHALQRTLQLNDTATVVADIDWDRFAPAFTVTRSSALLADLAEAQSALTVSEGSAAGAVENGAETGGSQLARLSPSERRRTLLELVRTEVARALGHVGPEGVASDRAFKDLGFDSLTGIELRNRLQHLTGLSLSTTLVFDQPNAEALATFLSSELASGDTAGSGDRSSEETSTAVSHTFSGSVVGNGEPMAIVAMSCRFPGGANSPEELWQLLANGVDAVSRFPTDRGWNLEALYHPDPEHAGTTYVDEGAFLYDAGRFDSGFFGISPREALAMDPQQRLLLETSWEALERARLAPSSLRGSRTGVFIGSGYQGYGAGLADLPEGVEGHLLTGSSSSVMSGRIAYSLGLEGPAVTVDTACSSSLVALHLAVQSLRQGECELALVGGAAVMSSPNAFIEFSRQRGLAADGRCKPFAAAADGTGWGEGVGMLLVERLSDARRLGHPVLAVVRGSAVNQDGASNGLTAPSGPAQQRVIEQALASAGLSASDVDAVEAHGTGTALGDPIEARALLATYGRERPADRPLLLGSLKSNIGHTQAASGIAGVIKTVLALQNGLLPKTLHVDEPSPHVDWSEGTVQLLAESVPWEDNGRPRRAAVSSFGVSGTNAHTIIEQAPASADEPAERESSDGERHHLWVVSGRDEVALRDNARNLATFARKAQGIAPMDVAHSLAESRTALAHRAVVLGRTTAELTAGLDGLGRGEHSAETVSGLASSDARLAFVFSGQGSQWWGMGRGLYESFPVFADVFDAVCVELDGLLGCSLREVLFEGDGSGLAGTGLTQPALFVVEVALCGLLGSWGVVPGVVAGHSVGEFAAAYVAGVVSLEDACRLVVARGRLMEDLASGGVMVAVEASEADVLPLLAGLEDQVGIAAINSPTSIVLSGVEDAVTTVVEQLGERRSKALTVSHAFHSPLMDPMLDAFRSVAESVTFHEPKLPIVSTVTGRPITTGEISNPEYWVQHIRQPVRYADAVQALAEQGVNVFLEVGPGGVLTGLIQTNLDHATAIPTLRADARSEDAALLAAAARLHVRGVDLHWPAVLGPHRMRRIDLPTYSFQRAHYWLDAGNTNAVGPLNAEDPAESEFWDTVENGRPDAVPEWLGLQQGASVDSVFDALATWRRENRTRTALDGLRYHTVWEPKTDLSSASLSGTWVVVTPEEEEAGPYIRMLRSRGAQPLLVTVADPGVDRESLAVLLGKAMAGHDASLHSGQEHDITGVLSLLAIDDRVHPDQPGLPSSLTSTVALIQALTDMTMNAPLWCVTRAAVSVSSSEPPLRPLQGLLWGLGRAVALETPERWGGLVDLPATPDDRALTRLADVLAAADAEDQLAVRGATVLVRRLTRSPRTSGPVTHNGWKPRGTVLITGGTGALGGHAARWLARAGADHLVLTSRRGAQAEGAAELAAELADMGTRVTIVAGDVADRAAVARLLASLADDAAPLTGVVHAAGLPQLNSITDTSLEELAAVVTAKVAGATHLDELLGDRELDAFILFSSVSGVWGSGKQAAYSAGNAFLDALAHDRRARGLAATAVAWGPWAESGMAADGGAEEYLRLSGLPSLSPDLAVSALQLAMDRDETAVVVADVDWERFAPSFTIGRPSPLLADLPEARAALDGDGANSGGSTVAQPGRDAVELVQKLSDLSVQDRHDLLLEIVQREAAAVLGYAHTDAIEPERAFRELGFDSLTAVELRNRLGTATGLKLPTTMVFDHPTPDALTDHLRSELFPGTATPDSPVDADSGEEAIRRALATIPLARLREAELMDVLLKLAGPDQQGTAADDTNDHNDSPESDQSIATMDVDHLIELALGDSDL
ncbi:type I polyketide synthase [Streptomyces sp. NPDC059256]|uniref:type I polyketide synthase n=1 Tax=Streptomyces sp. NPDC059256 TaxID=3346794 RepID=UPI00368855A7